MCASFNASADVIYAGITFADNAFADSVYSYSAGTNVGAGYDDPAGALGEPDYSGANNTSVSLGIGGELIVQFTDNSLTTSGDSTDDLYIFEVGGAVEYFNVAISIDTSTWIDLGDVLGQPTGLDMDGVAGVVLWAQYSYVRLRDVSPNQSGSPYGEADIDAVAAISSAPLHPVPEPLSLALFGLGMLVLV